MISILAQRMTTDRYPTGEDDNVEAIEKESMTAKKWKELGEIFLKGVRKSIMTTDELMAVEKLFNARYEKGCIDTLNDMLGAIDEKIKELDEKYNEKYGGSIDDSFAFGAYKGGGSALSDLRDVVRRELDEIKGDAEK